MTVDRRLVGRIALGVIAFCIVALGASLAWRAWRQHEVAQDLIISTPDGIDESRYVSIGGVDQWVQIRGEHRTNPVILLLHAGPGISMIGLTPVFRSWEQHFTVVQWDQRGAGKTFGRNGAAGCEPMTIDQMTRDGLELVQFLRQHLGQDKIIVLGHSWGTVLGLRMVMQQPELFSAYVGTGQLVAKAENERVNYDQLLETVRAARDRAAITALEQIGPPPYPSLDTTAIQLKWERAYDIEPEKRLSWTMTPYILFSPNYSLLDIYDFQTAIPFAAQETYDELQDYDARRLGAKFAVPFFIIQGDQDRQTPTALARRYFETIDAPKKEFIVLEGGGHSAMLTRSDDFLKELVARVGSPTIRP
jgi:pimeloyl-ACP methyl ester carboxylesterase